MLKWLQTLIAYWASVLIACLTAAAIHTQFTIASLSQIDIPVSVGQRIDATLADMAGMAPFIGNPLLFIVIAIAFLIGFITAFGVKQVLRGLSRIAYPIAGATAFGVMIAIMNWQLGTTPLSSARSDLGFFALCCAGGLGGVVFAALRPVQRVRQY